MAQTDFEAGYEYLLERAQQVLEWEAELGAPLFTKDERELIFELKKFGQLGPQKTQQLSSAVVEQIDWLVWAGHWGAY